MEFNHRGYFRKKILNPLIKRGLLKPIILINQQAQTKSIILKKGNIVFIWIRKLRFKRENTYSNAARLTNPRDKLV